LSGFGADEYQQLQDLIESGNFSPPSSGQIDTSSLPPGTFPGIGAGYGSADITTALSYDFTAVSSATISTNLGLRDLTMHRPVIILPGILGSWPTEEIKTFFFGNGAVDGGWSPLNLMPEPILSTYNPLLSTFENQLGYNRNVDLFFGAYDWRLSIAPDDSVDDGIISLSGLNLSDNYFQYSVEYLAYWLNQARHEWVDVYGNSPDSFQVDIIAHSMGGLVTRAFMQSDIYRTPQYAGVIHDVVTLGTPNCGSVNAFVALAETRDDIWPKSFSWDVNELSILADMFKEVRKIKGS
jgi:hypothetical protein